MRSHFDNMKKSASELLKDAETSQYTQAIVLSSVNGKEYGAAINNAVSEEKADETALLERLKAVNDTKIHYVLCMWQDGSIDLPSFAFRNLLCAIHPDNSEALLFVMTDDGVSSVSLSATMK